MAVSLNGVDSGQDFVVLRDAGGRCWLEAQDLARLRLRRPAADPLRHEGRDYLPLDAISGLVAQADESRGELRLSVPAAAFERTRLAVGARDAAPAVRAGTGAYLNYELSAQRIEGTDVDGASAELGVFTHGSVLLGSAVARSIAGDHALVRLDTTLVHDAPARMERLTLGDAVSDGTVWGSAVRFGGIGWGRNFSLRPDLVTTPLLAASGTAVVPSTVDVFVNNQRVSSTPLPPGPFVIDQLPAVTGAGQVNVVVRDALGREQVLSQPFYSSLRLLRAGLDQYEADFGKLRRDYGLSSGNYGPLFASASYRRGIGNTLTVEGHAEWADKEAHAAGLAAATTLGSFAVLHASLAGGGAPGSSGAYYSLGLERQGSRFSFALDHAVATEGYRQVSSAESSVLRFRRRSLAQVGASLGRHGSVALAAVRQEFYAGPTLETASLVYSRMVGTRGSLNFSASRTRQGGQDGNSFFLTWTWTLSERRAVVLSGNGGSGVGAPQDELYATYMQNPPPGPGQGWRAGASSAGNYEAQWQAQTTPGDLQLQAARYQGVTGQSADWSGAAIWMDGELRAARSVRSSFAVVEVADLADVPVYVDHQLVAHTDARGRALLPWLLPYEANRINIEPAELPLDTQIATRTLELAPAYRSGVLVRFPVSRVRAGTFRLLQPGGAPVPAGALLRFGGAEFPVGYDGAAYVTGYDHGMAGSASWAGGECRFRLDPPPMDDPQPDMGTVACRPVRAREATQ